ncbi:60S ribosomal protein L17 [Amylocystis lapponica]|nr:60S ribosomal protein L17 [Amylocystis lapponica]
MFARCGPAGRQAKASCSRSRMRSLATVTDSSHSSPRPNLTSNQDSLKPIINTGIILNRSPFLTRTPTPFERAYYAYHSRIQRALFNPFQSEFYFKPGSLLEGQFVEEEKERERAAFGGPVFKKSNVAGDLSLESSVIAGAAGTPEVVVHSKEEDPMPRIHEADEKGDARSLDRQGERNLYLLVNGKDHAGNAVWRFPQGGLTQDELLHEAAERDLIAECGSNMDTWIVSRKPVGVYEMPQPSTPNVLPAQTYVFFYKAHVLAGQVRPDGNILDFAWLTKEEIEPRVDKGYWTGVKDMLSDF